MVLDIVYSIYHNKFILNDNNKKEKNLILLLPFVIFFFSYFTAFSN